MTVLAVGGTHRVDVAGRRARRRPSSHPHPKHASARPARCLSPRRDHTVVVPQVTSGVRPFAARCRVGSQSYNDPLNKQDPLGMRPTDGHQEACAALLVGETAFFGRDPGAAANDLQASVSNPSRCTQRLQTLNQCVKNGGQAWDWKNSPSYEPWACGNWVPDCSTAKVQFFCDHGAILVKGGWTIFGAATIVAAIAGGNPAWGGCGGGAITGAWTGGDDVNKINASAVGSCITGAGAASGNVPLACLGGAVGTGVVATGFEPSLTSVGIGCLFTAGSAGVGTAPAAGSGAAAPSIVVSAAWEKVIQCALGGSATAITSSSEFGDAWEALMGCAGGAFVAKIDTT